MSASQSESIEVREEARSYRELAREFAAEPPAALMHALFLVCSLVVLSSLLALAQYGGVVAIEAFTEAANSQGYESYRAYVDGETVGWWGFLPPLAINGAYVVLHVWELFTDG